ncbi:MAG TPA: GDP-mannose 4,6-dehydratase [Ktedonobacterales bacterium]|nr:GDP-mannose 4,6-dehydratase [Ktedonobacterales bacterium]
MAIGQSAVADLAMNTQFWPGRRVFITGATGLVGAWLVKDLLALGAHVVALVRDADPQSEFYRSGDYRRTAIVQGRLEDFWTLERAINEHEINTVFHLAAQPIVGAAFRSPLQTFEANIRGTYNLLEACRLHTGLVQRVVIASSDKAYGAQATLPYTEDMPLQGVFPYEVSKSCTDLIAQSYHRTYDLPVAIARCGNIYGGGDLNWSRIVPDAIRCGLEGRRLVIRSDGTYIRDYIYVKDVSAAYLHLAMHLDNPQVRGEAFNFSPECAVSVLDLVATIQRLIGGDQPAPDVQGVARGEIPAQYLEATKARRILGWTPRYSLDAGLQETIAWYRAYLASPTSREIPGTEKGAHDRSNVPLVR